MRLEDKFFKSFFCLFLIAITISMILVATILFYYSENYIDERTAKDVIHMEKKKCKFKYLFNECIIIKYDS